MIDEIFRGEVYLGNLDGAEGCELQGDHPVLIVSNDIGNTYSSVVTVVPITSVQKRAYITQVRVSAGTANLRYNSTILCNQIRTLDKTRLKFKIGTFDEKVMQSVNFALKMQLGVN